MRRLFSVPVVLFLILIGWSDLFATIDSFQLPVINYSVTQSFGNYNSNYPCTASVDKRHTGTDIAGVANTTEVYAIAEGKVMFAQERGTCATNWGHVLVIEHIIANGNPKICSIYRSQ